MLLQVQEYLRNPKGKLNEDRLQDFVLACLEGVTKQLEPRKERPFSLYMSNAGKPYCQLWMEANAVKGEPRDYNSSMRNLFGYIIEAATILVLQEAGIEIEDKFKKVSLDIGGINIRGEYDVKIDGGIWDIKSASPYSFDNKFGNKGGFSTLLRDDPFGYVAQGYLYGAASGYPFRGWIVVNKSTGEFVFLEVPREDTHIKEAVLEEVDTKIRRLVAKEPFERSYGDIKETFYKKETGNRVLIKACEFCAFKTTCWPGVQALPSIPSKGKHPKEVWYTHIEE